MATITGTDDDDVLNGQKGAADTLIGLDGDDIYIVDNPTDVVVEDADGGYDTVQTRGAVGSKDAPYILPDHVEATSARYVVGNDQDNYFRGPEYARGGDGDDVFRTAVTKSLPDFSPEVYGEAGNDRIYVASWGLYDGGAGDDVFVLDQTRADGPRNPILVDRASDVGTDTVVAYAAARDFPVRLALNLDLRGEQTDGIENVVVRLAADSSATPELAPDPNRLLVHANDLNNRITGSLNAEIFYGEGGGDLIDGQGGIDWLIGGLGDDRVHGGDGADRLFGDFEDVLSTEGGRDKLYGGAGDDCLYGGAGNDYLDGGDGNDWLRGGQGADKFVFKGDWGADRVADFQHGRDIVVLADQGLTFADLHFTTVDADKDGAADDVMMTVDHDGFGAVAFLNHAGPLAASDFLL